jgi:hypothetical protein
MTTIFLGNDHENRTVSRGGMNYTNIYDLPESLVKALVFDDYDYEEAGDISGTGLIKPPRIRQLEKRYGHLITLDASELVWRMAGSIGHKIVERGAGPNVFSEERLRMRADGWDITGKVDLMRMQLDKYAIEDFKFRSVWAAKEAKPEDEAQLNIYATLARHNGFDIGLLRIISVLRDWSKLRATREPDYPQVGVVVREVPLWTVEAQDMFLSIRVLQHQKAENLADDDLPLCTEEERWHKPDVWAVKKRGNKRALKLFKDSISAQMEVFASETVKGRDLIVEHRPGEDTRCLHYCAVKNFCSHGKTLAPAGEETEAA